MAEHKFRKTNRLRKRSQFEQVLDQGQKTRVERICTLFALPNSVGSCRLGIIASRKVGNAIIRNRAKRILREIFRQNGDRFQAGTDLVIISGRQLPRLPYSVLERKILAHLPSGKNP